MPMIAVETNTGKQYSFFEWDFGNQMRCFYNQAGTSEPTIYAQYLYDGSGNRVKKIVRTQGGNYESTTYIGGMFESKTNGTEEQTIAHVMDGNSRIAMIREGYDFGDITPAIKYNLEDHLGSSTMLLETNGSLINKEEYYPFGETSFGSYAKKRYRYSGKEKDAESGLHYYGARYYLSWACKFISCDPMSCKLPQWSAYVGFNDNPMFFIDPLGLAAEGGPPEVTGNETEGMGSEDGKYVFYNGGWHQGTAESAEVTAKRSPWTNISGSQFRDDLEYLMEHPDSIYQGRTPWCGAGAAIYLAATLDPSGFKKNTREIYREGKVSAPFTLDLDASDNLYDEAVPNNSGIDNSAAFLAMSTFKENYYPINHIAVGDIDPGDYQDQFWGITYPEDVIDYLTTYHNISYTEGDGYYDDWGWNPFDGFSWDPIQGIKDLQSQGNTVLLIVNPKRLESEEWENVQHYLVVTSIQTSGEMTTIKYFNPNGASTEHTFITKYWAEIINWYGGFK